MFVKASARPDKPNSSLLDSTSTAAFFRDALASDGALLRLLSKKEDPETIDEVSILGAGSMAGDSVGGYFPPLFLRKVL